MRISRQLQIIGAVATASTLLAGCGVSSAAPKPIKILKHYNKHVTITWWSWTANPKHVIAAFEKAYPTIKVVHTDVGAGATEFTKLSTDIEAKKGAPDVVQIEYEYLPQFIATGGLVNISPYVHSYKKDFPTWVWNQVSQQGKVYAMPEDIGPLALLYRPKLFKKYGLATPTTWSIYAKDAIKYHKENPTKYMTFFPSTSSTWYLGLLWQAGARPFVKTKNGWKVDFTTPLIEKVTNYWGSLIREGAVQYTPAFTPSWESEEGHGNYASIIAAAWYPTYDLAPYIKAGSQHWTGRKIPQWVPGKFEDANWGGSANAVTVQSPHPQASALFAAWINTSKAGIALDATPIPEGGRGLYPADKNAPEAPAFNLPLAVLGNQKVNPEVFKPAAAHVNPNFEWSPWTAYIHNELSVDFAKAASGSISWDSALKTLQKQVISFGQSQGYKVSS